MSARSPRFGLNAGRVRATRAADLGGAWPPGKVVRPTPSPGVEVSGSRLQVPLSTDAADVTPTSRWVHARATWLCLASGLHFNQQAKNARKHTAR
jgi:hypothetical protein